MSNDPGFSYETSGDGNTVTLKITMARQINGWSCWYCGAWNRVYVRPGLGTRGACVRCDFTDRPVVIKTPVSPVFTPEGYIDAGPHR